MSAQKKRPAAKPKVKPKTRAKAKPRQKRKASYPIEHSILLTATLCLLALGVVMVFSASSTTSLLGEAGDGAFYLKRTALYGVFGLIALRLLSVNGVKILRPLTVPLMGLSIFLLVARPDSRRGHRGERRQALDRHRPLPDPAVGDRKGCAHPLRGPAPGHPAEDDALDPRDGPVPRGGRTDLAPRGGRARPRHRDGRLLRRRRDAGRGRRPVARSRSPRGRDRGGDRPGDHDRALPDGAPDRLPQPRRRPLGGRLPGKPGADRAGLRRVLRRRAWGEPPKGLLSARGPHGHDRGGCRRGARA